MNTHIRTYPVPNVHIHLLTYTHPICSFMCSLAHSPNIHIYSFTPSHSHQNGYSCAHPNPHSPNILTFTSMHMLTTSYTHPTCTLRCLPPSHNHPTYTLIHSHLATFTKHTIIHRHPQLPTCTLTYSCIPSHIQSTSTNMHTHMLILSPHTRDMYIQVLSHITSTQHTYL